MSSKFKGSHSPWGPIQYGEELAPGLVLVGTSSHGGIRMSPERLEEFEKALPSWQSAYSPRGWLEEDCDANLAYVVWPQHFKAEHVAFSREYVMREPYFAKVRSELQKLIPAPKGWEAVEA